MEGLKVRGSAMVCLFVCPPHSYAENLTPNVMVLVGGSLGRSFGHEGGAFINGILLLMKKTSEN